MFGKIEIKHTKEVLGSYVRSMRKSHKVSQEELAEALELSRVTIQNLERGKNFTIDTFLKVINHFDLLNDFHDSMVEKTNELINNKSLY